MWWLGEGTVVDGCGWSLGMAVVRWRLVGALVACPPVLMGEKYI